jgi:hypothetical protein
MTTFDERERAFEAKWAHDEEMQFRIIVRRNELLGRWAATEQGLAEAELERYVTNLVALALKTKTIDALYLKLRADLGTAHSDAVILRKMDEFLDAATLDTVGAMSRMSISPRFFPTGIPGPAIRKVECISACSGKYPCDPRTEAPSVTSGPASASLGR